MKRLFLLIMGILAVFCWYPVHTIHAAEVTVHMTASDEVVRVYDVTSDWWQQAPTTQTGKEGLQEQLAKLSLTTATPIAQATSDATRTATFSLPATVAGRQAVYLFVPTGNEQRVVVPMTNAVTIAIWPKAISQTPAPKPNPPRPAQTWQPHLPNTGNRQMIALVLLGIIVLSGSIVLARRRV